MCLTPEGHTASYAGVILRDPTIRPCSLYAREPENNSTTSLNTMRFDSAALAATHGTPEVIAYAHSRQAPMKVARWRASAKTASCPRTLWKGSHGSRCRVHREYAFLSNPKRTELLATHHRLPDVSLYYKISNAWPLMDFKTDQFPRHIRKIESVRDALRLRTNHPPPSDKVGFVYHYTAHIF
jgi:hypothetical protein